MSGFVHKTFDFRSDGLGLFKLFRDEPYLFFLDSSASPHGSLGRYSFIGFDPFYVFTGQGPAISAELRKQFSRIKSLPATPLTPLPAGAVGFLSYEAGLYWENIKRRSKDDLNMPEAMFGFYDVVLTIDHWKNKLHVVSTGLPEKNARLRRQRALSRLEAVVGKIEGNSSFLKHASSVHNSGPTPALKSNLKRANYNRAIERILSYIREGDVYQVNFSHRFSCDLGKKSVDPVVMYASLRRQAPAHFTSYFAGEDFYILSSSPERFLHMHKRKVETRPMKGTRPRGENF